MSEPRPVVVARGWQHLLPVVLVVISLLELAAILPAGPAGQGPATFVPASLAVVWAAFLPASRRGLLVKVLVALGAAGFVVARAALMTTWWLERPEDPASTWSAMVLGVSGVALGIVLLVWAVLDVAATRSAVRRVRHDEPPAAVSPSTPPRVQGPGRESPSSLWQSVSTPWPRRDGADPDGTLIRPPRPSGPHREGR